MVEELFWLLLEGLVDEDVYNDKWNVCVRYELRYELRYANVCVREVGYEGCKYMREDNEGEICECMREGYGI